MQPSSDHSEQEQFKLPVQLRHYVNKDFVIQLKVRFIYYLCLAMVLVMVFVVFTTIISQSRNPSYQGIYYPIIILESSLVLFYLFSLLLLIKGLYKTASHFILIVSFVCAWLVMFIDKSQSASKIDTIVYIFAILSSTPILLITHRRSILMYTFLNVAVLLLFSYSTKSYLSNIPFDFVEYSLDNLIAMIFVGFVAYNTLYVNNIAIKKALIDLEEKKKAEDKLIASEIKFREMADLLPQIVFETDHSGKLTYVNKNAFLIFGYQEEDFKRGINVIDTISDADRERAVSNFKKINEGVLSSGNRYLARKKDGSVFPVIIYANAIIKDGSFIGSRGIVIDNSEREKAQKDLSESEERFYNLFDQAPVPMVQTHKDGKIIRCNSMFIETLGFDTEDIKNTDNLWNLAFPDEERRKDAHETRKEFAQKVLNRESLAGLNEYEITDKYGNIHTMLFSASVFGDYFIESLIDITDRKKAEKALKQSEVLFKSLIESLPYAVFVVDMNGDFIMANKIYCQEIDVSPEEIIGLNINGTGGIIDREKALLAKKLIDENGHYDNLEVKFISRKGNEIIIYMSARVLTMNNQQVMLCASVNVTEKKKIEAELQKHRDHLETLVNERTIELEKTNQLLLEKNLQLERTLNDLSLAHQQLLESEKMASLGIIAAGIAHEINNPLNFIHGGIIGLEGYIEDYLSDHQEKFFPYINAIHTGVERASKIVTSLNHFSRQTESVNEDCNIHEVIDNCLLMLENQLKYKITIDKDYTAENFDFIGNDGKLHQAFLNILTNAAQAIEADGSISIKTDVRNNQLIVVVKDSGCGINPNDLKRIFEPFFTTKAPGKGSGLGLSITYNIIREHNGSIQVESKLNEGTTFVISLPLHSKNN